jgi:MoxR-like ATPase
VVDDLRHLAADVLRHRLTLSYDAVADGVDPDAVVAAVLEAVQPPAYEVLSSRAAVAA